MEEAEEEEEEVEQEATSSQEEGAQIKAGSAEQRSSNACAIRNRRLRAPSVRTPSHASTLTMATPTGVLDETVADLVDDTESSSR